MEASNEVPVPLVGNRRHSGHMMLLLNGLSMPWALFGGWVIVATGAGVVFGFVRGLDYLPTLPFALIEGGIIFGAPAGTIGLLLVGLWCGGRRLIHIVRRNSHPAARPDLRA